MKPIATAKRPKKTWHAVSVVVTPRSCEAARRLRHVRYLSAEAPRFPVVNCATPSRCPCAYRHFDDRRGGSRRHGDLLGTRKARKSEEERRRGPDRRRPDFDES